MSSCHIREDSYKQAGDPCLDRAEVFGEEREEAHGCGCGAGGRSTGVTRVAG